GQGTVSCRAVLPARAGAHAGNPPARFRDPGRRSEPLPDHPGSPGVDQTLSTQPDPRECQPQLLGSPWRSFDAPCSPDALETVPRNLRCQHAGLVVRLRQILAIVAGARP